MVAYSVRGVSEHVNGQQRLHAKHENIPVRAEGNLLTSADPRGWFVARHSKWPIALGQRFDSVECGTRVGDVVCLPPHIWSAKYYPGTVNLIIWYDQEPTISNISLYI